MAELGLTLHPDKASVGRVERGFDFLGYRLGGARVEVARPAVERMAERVTRLYEQGASEKRIGDYVRRWLGWMNGGWKSENDEKRHEQRARLGGVFEVDGERKGRAGGRDSQGDHKDRGSEKGGEWGCHAGEGNALIHFIRPACLDEPPQPPKPSPCHDNPTRPPDASRTPVIPELVQKPMLRHGCRCFASVARP